MNQIHVSSTRLARSATSDVIVVGAGLAGLFTALKLAPRPVTVVSAARFGEGASSLWAQGGIAAALAEGDRPEDHAADTIAAGAGIVDEKIALLLAREARERIEDLLRYGVPFDKDLEGHLTFSREAAHGRSRILHVKGDTAGRAIMHALMAAVRATPSITVLEGFAARDLVLRDGRVAGLEVAPRMAARSRAGLILPASAVVLATGGAGQIYAVTTNPREARGEGIAIAARAGAVIADAEFVQFHPTAINIGRDPAPLATEALRGEGAMLINARGERFMRAVHADAELGPRDVVARAVYREVASGRGAFLDCRSARRRARRALPDRLRGLPRGRHRSGARADPGRAGRALPHGRHPHRRAGAEHRRRAVGLRRGRLDRRAWREPAGVQLAARGGGVRRPRRQGHRRLSADAARALRAGRRERRPWGAAMTSG